MFAIEGPGSTGIGDNKLEFAGPGVKEKLNDDLGDTSWGKRFASSGLNCTTLTGF